ncbi:MAG TPA: hypothetical protein VIN07_00970, partial [Flavipsychrobacter sp.]
YWRMKKSSISMKQVLLAVILMASMVSCGENVNEGAASERADDTLIQDNTEVEKIIDIDSLTSETK